MKCNTCDVNKTSYHTVSLSSEVILSLKKLGAMGDSYNSVILRLLEKVGSVGAEKEES